MFQRIRRPSKIHGGLFIGLPCPAHLRFGLVGGILGVALLRLRPAGISTLEVIGSFSLIARGLLEVIVCLTPIAVGFLLVVLRFSGIALVFFALVVALGKQ